MARTRGRTGKTKPQAPARAAEIVSGELACTLERVGDADIAFDRKHLDQITEARIHSPRHEATR